MNFILQVAVPFFFLAVGTLQAAEYYLTPSGAGAFSGADWDNALAKSALNTTLNTTMGAGDTLYVGSGDYGSAVLTLSSSGTELARKSIIGVDTGAGLPHFSGDGSWSRINPNSSAHQWRVIKLRGDYWTVENLELSGVKYAIHNDTADSASHCQFTNLHIHHVLHGVYLNNLSDSRFDNVLITEYTKHGFRLNRGGDHVVFEDCTADLTNGDSSWWDYSDGYPFGFVLHSSGSHSDISFINCVSVNNRQNNQNKGYWQGDGFVTESNASGVSFENCLAMNNDDGGFDLKSSSTTLTDCVSVLNYRGFRLWYGGSIENCIAVAPYRRSNGNLLGGYGGNGVWTKNGNITLHHFTFYADAGTAVYEEGSGSILLTNSILAFSGAAGSFSGGSVTLGTGTVTYRPGSGVDPDFVNPGIAWDGLGGDFDSLTYGETKGYSFGATGPGVISANITGSAAYKLEAGDLAGVEAVGHWNNIGIDASGTSIVGSTVNLPDAVDHLGNATGVTLTIGGSPFGYVNNTPVTSDPNTKMMASERGSSGSGDGRIIQATQVPFDTYDVVVYFGGVSSGGATPYVMNLKLQEPDGSGGWQDMSPASDILYLRDTDRVWDGTFEESTALSSGAAVDGQEYVVFRDVTLESFRIRTDTGVGRRAGLSGFQIIEKSEPVLMFDAGSFTDYAGQSTAGGMSLEAADTAVHLTGNTWRKYPFSYTVTANTMMEVTVEASDVGELMCIGLDSDNDYATGTTHVKFAGSQSHASFVSVGSPYTAGAGPVTYIIPIGSVFTGNMTYLTFVGDDDAGEDIDVTFSDIRLYEE
ncbi:right-handed parallel beta-helix repeat-containing protein [Kiritimatiellaeota bacterium B1221]|nr:right-handed parallel beta-helix repeat-containing protein [Kiritimatiellaeota bacterium B1221]